MADERAERARAEFEAWAKSQGFSLNSYVFPLGAPSKYVWDTEFAWYVWQAARREERKRTRELFLNTPCGQRYSTLEAALDEEEHAPREKEEKE